jgi:hypothetical protein
VLVLLHQRVAGLDVIVPERADLFVGHGGELLAADLEVCRRDIGVRVRDDRGISVAGDLDLVGRGSMGAAGHRHVGFLARFRITSTCA